MSRRLYYIAIICALSIAFCIGSARAKEPQIIKQVLDNGLTVVIKEDHALPIVSIEARFRIGSASEGRFLGSGISHFVEHMLFKGTPTRPHSQIEKEVKSYGGTINGYTSFDSTGYRLTVESKYFKEGLGLIIDAVTNPSFVEDEVEKEREVILKEIKLGRDNPGKRAFQLLMSHAYAVHPYKHPIIGYEELFKKITREDLIFHHKEHYTPDNMVLGICGDVKSNAVLRELEELTKNYKRGMGKAGVLPKEPGQIAEREYKERASVHLSRVLIGYHSVPIWHEDLFALDVLASVLGEGESSVLHTRLVEEEKIAHSVSVYDYTPKDPGVFFINVLLDEENIPKVMEAIDRELGIIKMGKIDKAQLVKAKNRTLASYLLDHETVQAQAADLVMGEILAGNPDFSKRYVEGIEGVIPEDVILAANSYLKENSRTIIHLLPKLTEEDKELTDLFVSGKENIEVKKTTLPSGMRVLVREDHSLPLVSIRAVLRGGVRVEDEEDNGISNLTAHMLLAGTKKRTKFKIYNSIEESGGAISNFSGNNSFGVSITLLSKDLDMGIDIASDILTNSVFPKSEFEKARELTLAAIKNREDDIFDCGIKLLKENLFKEHPYRFTILGEKETVEKLKRKSSIEFYKQFCVPPNLVLAVFGDVELEETIEKIESRFKRFKGEIPPRLAEETPKLKAIDAPDEKIMDKEQVLVIGGLKTIKVSDPDRYAFSVASSILSGADGRFYYDVRNKLGISYTQGVSSVPGLDRGYFLFYIATSAEHTELAGQLIVEQVERLRNDSVTEEEMQLAKSDLIGTKLRALQSNGSLAFETSLDELYGLGYDNFKKFDTEIRSVTKEDIKRIVEKYFDPEDLSIVTLGDLPSTNQ